MERNKNYIFVLQKKNLYIGWCPNKFIKNCIHQKYTKLNSKCYNKHKTYQPILPKFCICLMCGQIYVSINRFIALMFIFFQQKISKRKKAPTEAEENDTVGSPINKRKKKAPQKRGRYSLIICIVCHLINMQFLLLSTSGLLQKCNVCLD